MPTLFLDANILFSAAYKPDSRLRVLWSLSDVTLVTSAYAVEEARRNLPEATQKEALEILLKDTRLLLETRTDLRVPASLGLPGKDLPILAGAVQIKADILLTGDFQHFGPLFGKKIRGVLILTPAAFLASRKTP